MRSMIHNDSFQKYFFYSFFFHIAIFAIFVFSFERSSRNFVLENKNDATEIVNAVIINPSKIETPKPIISKPKITEIKKPEPSKVQAKKIAIEKKPEPIKTVAKNIIPIPTKIKTPKKEMLEKQLLADLEKEVKQKKKVKIKHVEIEKAFAEELKQQKAKALEQQLLKEKNALASAQAKKMQGIVDKYKALILQAISQNWIVPNGAKKNLYSELLIRLAPGGVVLDVQLVKSSGDAALDRSARTAVLKASPLPVPVKADEFESFRHFILKVKPENIVANDSDLKQV